MQPREVAGLQSLAKAHGGSLTINPHTGLPEANFLGDIFGAVAPIGLGMLLGPAGLGMSALGAGLATGVAGFALSGGNLMKGVTAGLGGYGGSGLGESLKSFGATAPIASTEAVARAGITNASSIPGTVGADALTGGAGTLGSTAGGTLAGTVPYSGMTGSTGQLGADMAFRPASMVSSVAPAQAAQSLATQIPAQSAMQQVGAGAMKALEHPIDFFNSGNGIRNAFTLASPLMAIKPEPYKAPEDNSYKMKYEGPYTAQDRKPRMPTAAETQQLQAQGSPEFSYFGDTNPYPGFNKAPGYAVGGSISGAQDTSYNAIDGTAAQNQPSENYGLARLEQLSQNGTTGYAGGGPVSFDAGGYIPQMGSPSYGIAPTDLSVVAGLGQGAGQNPNPSSAGGLSTMLGNAISDPMGKTSSNQGYMGMGGMQDANGGMQGKGNGGIFGNLMQQVAPQATGSGSGALTMQDYIDAARRTYNPSASVATGTTPGAVEQAQFTNINPQQPVLKAMGGGIHALKSGGSPQQGGYLDGAGDGMSDSIPATIGSKQPARLADGEFVVPADVVSHLGNGSTKAGAQHLYGMMDKVRKARTGRVAQGKQINPSKFLQA
jgi:hypothetical protein